MPKLEGTVTEKWSRTRILNARVTVDGNYFARTNKQGWFTGNAPVGTHRLCVEEPSHEETCQSINLVSDTAVNIQMKPIFGALGI